MLISKHTARTMGTLLCFLLISGCQSAPEVKEDPTTGPNATQQGAEARVVVVKPKEQHPALDALVWTQASVEYDACTAQSYNAAKFMLHHAIPKRTWTALPDLQRGRAMAKLPMAVILDVDETVLDNTPYQARLLRDGKPFRSESWASWCREAAAEPISGALEFAKHATEKGITIFYVTNRDHSLEEATRENLARHGFPLDDAIDTVLTRGEKPEWADPDKQARREAVAGTHRVLLIIGDNLGDFIPGYLSDLDTRQKLFEAHAEMWGKRWIMLPNPLYGSWEAALYEHDYERTASEKGALKIKALEYKDSREAP